MAARTKTLLVKSLAKLFAESYRPYTFGAFGKPTPLLIEEALSAERLVYLTQDSNHVVAAAIFSILRADSYHADFSGRRCLLSRGSLYVRHLALSRDSGDELVSSLVGMLSQLVEGVPFWIEIHEENAELRERVERQLGFRYVMTKILASSDIRGLYLRHPTMGQMLELGACEIPTMRCLDEHFLSDRERGAILKELHNYASRDFPWGQHYSHYNKRNSWTAFALRGYRSTDAWFIIKPSEMSKGWKAENPELLLAACGDTPAVRSFPATMRVVARIPGGKERVRFMRLTPQGGELSRHADVTDRDAGTVDGRVTRLHIPIVTHPNVLFESWGLRGEHQKLHFASGGLYYLDQRKPHRVVNRSPLERIHLVVDVYASPELRKLIPS
jgi:hypothetical protein